MSTQKNPQITGQSPPVDPLKSMIRAYYNSQLIYIAATLRIADFLKDGPKSTDELAELVEAHPHALYRVLRALASQGIFAETQDRHFELTPLAEPLQSEFPGSVRAEAIMQIDEHRWRSWGELLYSVKTGKPAFEHIYGMDVYDYYTSIPEVSERFNEGMAELTRRNTPAIVAAYDFSRIGRIVDLGAGRGDLIAAILKAYPHMHGVILDLPNVIDDARVTVKAEGVADRCELIQGDFFESVPRGGDAYILKSIIHGENDENAVRILKNCRSVMADDGKVLIIQDVVPTGNEPAQVKMSDILMLLTVNGWERTEAEYRLLYEAAGFKLTKVYPTASSFSIIEGVVETKESAPNPIA